MGIDLKHLQKLEYAVLNPTLRTVVAATEAFGVPLARLFRRSTTPPNPAAGRSAGQTEAQSHCQIVVLSRHHAWPA